MLKSKNLKKQTNKKLNYTTESFELYPKLRVKFKLVAEKS